MTEASNNTDLSRIFGERRIPCPECGYDLRGMRELTCPECGTHHEINSLRANPEHAVARLDMRTRKRVIAVGIVVSAMIALGIVFFGRVPRLAFGVGVAVSFTVFLCVLYLLFEHVGRLGAAAGRAGLSYRRAPKRADTTWMRDCITPFIKKTWMMSVRSPWIMEGTIREHDVVLAQVTLPLYAGDEDQNWAIASTSAGEHWPSPLCVGEVRKHYRWREPPVPSVDAFPPDAAAMAQGAKVDEYWLVSEGRLICLRRESVTRNTIDLLAHRIVEMRMLLADGTWPEGSP